MKEIKQPKHSISLIIAAVSRVTDVPANCIKSHSRKKEVVIARDIAIGIICFDHHLTLKKIGDIFGGRNHATIINSRRKFVNVCNKPIVDKVFSRQLEKVYDILN